jgi:hypothetical protein
MINSPGRRHAGYQEGAGAKAADPAARFLLDIANRSVDVAARLG